MKLRELLLVCVAAGTVAVSCSSSGETGSTVTSQLGGAKAPTCVPPTDTKPVDATSVGESTRDFNVISFDGTPIRAHWFPHPDATEDSPHATVLMGPGWSLAGDTDVDSPSILGSIGIDTMRSAGYNVLTWDPRGFGESGGTAMVDSPEYEGRDVQQLIDWVATMPTVKLDGRRDPRMGMVGGSYGGGIQLATAPEDCRIDALVPIVAWHSLKSSLFKSETVKLGWASVLADSATTHKVDGHVSDAYKSAQANGRISEKDQKWFISRGPGDLVKKITVPTLFIHGTIDTLFTLDEAVTNYEILRSNGVPTKMLWNCDGHGICLVDEGDKTRAATAAVAWINRYVGGDKSVDTGPGFDIIDQFGVRYTADKYQKSAGEPVRGEGTGSLKLTASGGSGPVILPEGFSAILAGVARDITPGKATNAVNVAVETGGRDALLLGAPKLTVTYKGTAGQGDRPQRVFAQLVDESTGFVIGNQITPLKVQLDGREHKLDVDLEMIAFALKPDSKITLQITPTTVAYIEPQLGGQVDFSKIDLRIPVATYLKKAS